MALKQPIAQAAQLHFQEAIDSGIRSQVLYITTKIVKHLIGTEFQEGGYSS